MVSDVLTLALGVPVDADQSTRACLATEKRKTWIYEVPLPYTHRLRNLVNSSASPLPLDDIKKFDLPVVASAMKVRNHCSSCPVFYVSVSLLTPSVTTDSVSYGCWSWPHPSSRLHSTMT